MTGKRKQPYMEIIEGIVAGVAVSLVRLTRICRDLTYEIVSDVENVLLEVK